MGDLIEQLSKRILTLNEQGIMPDLVRELEGSILKIEQLQAERDALAAHVERFKSACEMLYHWHDTSDGGMVVDGDVVRKLWELESTTPQQSLAEHDAEVARKAFVAGANWQAVNQPVINREADKYIEREYGVKE